MISWIFLLIVSGLAILSSSVGKVYRASPPKELMRRASSGDAIAGLLHPVAQHGMTVEVAIWLLSGLWTSIAVVLASHVLPSFIAAAFAFCLMLLVFAVIPAVDSSRASKFMAGKLAPRLAGLLSAVGPVSNRIIKFVRSRRPVSIHTGLYDKADLIELFERQKVAGNNRIEQNELNIVLHALEFGDRMVKDIMTPRRMVRFVSGDEPVGPILTSELHGSGFSRFPVTGESQDQIIGTLYLRDLVEYKKSGVVKNIMKSSVYYVNQDRPLEHVLSAFIKTKHHIFIAVNEFEEIVGLITIEDVIEQIIGHEIVDEFDQHADLRAVAALYAKQDHISRKE